MEKKSPKTDITCREADEEQTGDSWITCWITFEIISDKSKSLCFDRDRLRLWLKARVLWELIQSTSETSATSNSQLIAWLFPRE